MLYRTSHFHGINAEFENDLAVFLVLTMIKAHHRSCLSHELLFYTLRKLAAIKYICKAGHPADPHQSKQCLKDSSMTPLHQWKAFQQHRLAMISIPFYLDGQALPYLFHSKLQKPNSLSITNLLSTFNCLKNKLKKVSERHHQFRCGNITSSGSLFYSAKGVFQRL